jgi:uncharacterized protein (DUF983 family)
MTKDKLHLIKLGSIETVAGICPHCQEESILLAIVSDYYRCTNCGEDTRQYVNGSIKYLTLNESDHEWLKSQALDK